MSHKKSHHSKRSYKSIVVEPFKQLKLGIYVIAISFTFSVLVAFVFLNAFFEQYQHVMKIFQIVDPKMQWEMMTNDVFYQNAVRLGILLLAFVVITLVVVFHVTHKYYGPIVSILRLVESVRQGDYSQRIDSRKGDALEDVVKELNHMTEVLEHRHGGSSTGNRTKKKHSRDSDSA